MGSRVAAVMCFADMRSLPDAFVLRHAENRASWREAREAVVIVVNLAQASSYLRLPVCPSNLIK
jgi:hypothetical protein